MRLTRYNLAATLPGLAAMLTLGCSDATSPRPEPTTGAIRVTVLTTGAESDIDPDGYALIINGGSGHAVGVNATVTISDLPTGVHLVRLEGLAANCSVSGTSTRWVDVITDTAAPSVSFTVACTAKSAIGSGAGDWDY